MIPTSVRAWPALFTAALLTYPAAAVAQQPAPAPTPPAAAASAAQPAAPAIKVSGEVRLRAELFDAPTASRIDDFTLLRTRVGVLASASERVRAFVQLQDARAFGEETSTADGVADALDLHQGYLEFAGTLRGAPAVLRGGRQEIALGNERLVGAFGWSNTGRSFDGARALFGSPTSRWNATAFVATVHETGARYGRGAQQQGVKRDHTFWGLYAQSKLLESFAFYDDHARFRTFAAVDRATFGGRLQTPRRAGLDLSLEGAYQTGDQERAAAASGGRATPQDIQAYFGGARLGWQTPSALLPTLGVGVDYLSGDDDPADDDYQAFNTLYATNHKWYGYMDLFLDPAANTRDRGLVDVLGSAALGLGRYGRVNLDVHRFSLADHSGLDESEIGWELDVTYPFQLDRATRFLVGYGLFRNGAAAPAIGLGEDGETWHGAYLQATVSF